MGIDPKKAQAYEAQLKKLQFSIPDADFTVDLGPDIGATYVKVIDERVLVAARPTEGARMWFLALNPAAAFDLANAILDAGERAGWYTSHAIGGHRPHKTVQ